MGVLFHLSYWRKLCQRPGRAPVFDAVFSSCHTIAFSEGYGFCEGCLIPSETSRHAASGWWEAWGFFFSAMMRRKSKILIPPLSLSHVQASICVSRSNVIIPFCSGCCHGVVPPPLAWRLSYSNFTAQLTPQSAASKSSNICNLETQQTARLSGSNGLKMFAFMTHIAVTVRLGGKYLHEWAALRWNPKKHELAAACLKQKETFCAQSKCRTQETLKPVTDSSHRFCDGCRTEEEHEKYISILFQHAHGSIYFKVHYFFKPWKCFWIFEEIKI